MSDDSNRKPPHADDSNRKPHHADDSIRKPLHLRHLMARRLQYRRVIPGVVIAMLVLLIVIILFNSLLVTRLSRENGEISTSLHRMSTLHGTLAFSVRVFDNIKDQIPATGSLTEQKRTSLASAYTSNRAKYLDALKSMDALMVRIHVLSHSWLLKPLLSRMIVDPEFDPLVEDLSRQLAAIAAQIPGALPAPENFETLSTETLKPYHTQIPLLIEDLYERNADFSVRSTGQALRNVNIAMTFLFLAVVFLSFLLYRLMHYGFRYVETGLDLMNRHKYDPEALPALHPLFREESDIAELFHSVLSEQHLVEEVKHVAGHGYILQDVLENLFEQIRPVLETDRIGVAYIDHERGKIIAEHGVIHDGSIRLGPGFEADIATSDLRLLIDSGEPSISPDLRVNLANKPTSIALNLIVEEGIRSNIVLPLKTSGTVFAFLFLSSRKTGRYTTADLGLGKNIAYELSPLLDKAFLAQTIFSRITSSFADLVDRKDNETGDHIKHMVRYSTLIAEALRTHPEPAYCTTARFVRDIANNAASHDIGKVAIPDSILKKPGKLDPEEWTIMKTHAAVGGDIFASLRMSLRIFNQQFYVTAENIARHHHERWDGTGYPDGLSRQDIPLESRIIAVADVFDALTSRRVYKEAWTLDDAVGELERVAGSHLDPVLVTVFLSHKEEVIRISSL